jgi:hypothetical protein
VSSDVHVLQGLWRGGSSALNCSIRIVKHVELYESRIYRPFIDCIECGPDMGIIDVAWVLES